MKNTERLEIRLSKELKELLEHTCTKQEKTISDFIREAIKEKINTNPHCQNIQAQLLANQAYNHLISIPYISSECKIAITTEVLYYEQYYN